MINSSKLNIHPVVVYRTKLMVNKMYSVHHSGSKRACSPLRNRSRLKGLPTRLIAMRMMIIKRMRTMLRISKLTLLIKGGMNQRKLMMRRLNKIRTPNLSSQLSSRISSKMLAKSNATNLI